jgi:hypothetical protein
MLDDAVLTRNSALFTNLFFAPDPAFTPAGTATLLKKSILAYLGQLEVSTQCRYQVKCPLIKVFWVQFCS